MLKKFAVLKNSKSKTLCTEIGSFRDILVLFSAKKVQDLFDNTVNNHVSMMILSIPLKKARLHNTEKRIHLFSKIGSDKKKLDRIRHTVVRGRMQQNRTVATRK